MHEDKDKNVVTATFELPGVNKQDVNIDVRNNVLTVSGESKFASDRDEKGYVVRERRFGRFSRSLSLPEGTKVCILGPYDPTPSTLTHDDSQRISRRPWITVS